MPRYRLVVEYDGTPYVGWQFQASGRSVQGEIEAAIARFAGEAPRIQGAGRTDAGVHASGQVVHLDLGRDWKTDTIRDAINAHLRPQPIAVLSAATSPDGFNARTSAIRRHYRYLVLNRRAPPALERNRVWHVPYPVDAALMHHSAQVLLGRHDFTTFRASECQANSPVRTLERFGVERRDDVLVIEVSARSFLHSQVRSMVGTILLVGAGRRSVDDVRAALDARRRSACGPLAPPHGLTLVGVDYPGLSGQPLEQPRDRHVEEKTERRDRDRE